MKKDNSKFYRTLLYKYVESLGAVHHKDCDTGSTYYKIDKLKIRFSDHIGLAASIHNIDILLKNNQFVCVFYRDFRIFNQISEVKEWISNILFTTRIFNDYDKNRLNSTVSPQCSKSDEEKYKEQITNLNNQIKNLKKKIKEYEETSGQKIKNQTTAINSLHNKIAQQKNYINELEGKIENYAGQINQLKGIKSNKKLAEQISEIINNIESKKAA